jgi:hypothetical protein
VISSGILDNDLDVNEHHERPQFTRMLDKLVAEVMETVDDKASDDESLLGGAAVLDDLLSKAQLVFPKHGPECAAIRAKGAVATINALEKRGNDPRVAKGDLVQALTLLSGADALGGSKGHHERFDTQVDQFERIRIRITGDGDTANDGADGVMPILMAEVEDEAAIKASIPTLRGVLESSERVYKDVKDPRYFDLQLKVSNFGASSAVQLYSTTCIVFY